MQVMKQLRLLPLQPGETVEQKVTAFQAYDDEVMLYDVVQFAHKLPAVNQRAYLAGALPSWEKAFLT